jgi:hypothetical protein
MASIGSDPEFFIRDSLTGQVVTAIETVGGAKGRPVEIPGLGDGFGAQEDNVMVEYNIPAVECSSQHRASSYSSYFSDHIVRGREGALSLVRTKLSHVEADIGRCTRLFTFEQLAHPQAETFGCSQDYDAYRNGDPCGGISPAMLRQDRGEYRFAGGHVHLGYESEAPDFVAAQMADVFLGLPSVALDKQGERRALYGSPGRFRPTPYGIEYRTLSNFWIWDENLATNIGYRALMLCFMLEDIEELVRVHAEIPWNDVAAAITREDDDLAASLLTFIHNDLGVQTL